MRKGFGKSCRDEVEFFEQQSARDYRLNHRLYKSCQQDVSAICPDASAVQEGELCGGKVRWAGQECAGSAVSPGQLPLAGMLQRPRIGSWHTSIQPSFLHECRAAAVISALILCILYKPAHACVRQVLACLSERHDDIKNSRCRKEVSILPTGHRCLTAVMLQQQH